MTTDNPTPIPDLIEQLRTGTLECTLMQCALRLADGYERLSSEYDSLVTDYGELEAFATERTEDAAEATSTLRKITKAVNDARPRVGGAA